MPRNVRNFWIELDVDGKRTKVATGPRAKDGGFMMHVGIREEGAISKRYFAVAGNVVNGELQLTCTAVGDCATYDTTEDSIGDFAKPSKGAAIILRSNR